MVPTFLLASRQMEMQEEQKALQSAAKLMCPPLILSLEWWGRRVLDADSWRLSGTDLEIFKPASLVTFLQVAERHRTGTLWEAVVQPVSAGTRMRTTPPGNNVLSEESQAPSMNLEVDVRLSLESAPAQNTMKGWDLVQ